MKNVKFKPKLDKLFWLIFIPISILMIAITLVILVEPFAFWIIIPCDLFVFYFLISPLFGYVELREETVFIRFGFFMKREIPYKKIRGFTRERKFYADSMLALKNSLDHVNIKYNTFDMISVSVNDNEQLISMIEQRRRAIQPNQ